MNSFMRVGGALSDRGFKRAPSFRCRRSAGLTLVEVSVVMFAMSLMSTLLLSTAKAWQRGSDRTKCIESIQAVQKGVLGYASMSGVRPGETVSGLEAKVVGSGKYFEELPACPSSGSYTLGGDRIPDVGEFYMTCSLQTSLDHLPDDLVGW